MQKFLFFIALFMIGFTSCKKETITPATENLSKQAVTVTPPQSTTKTPLISTETGKSYSYSYVYDSQGRVSQIFRSTFNSVSTFTYGINKYSEKYVDDKYTFNIDYSMSDNKVIKRFNKDTGNSTYYTYDVNDRVKKFIDNDFFNDKTIDVEYYYEYDSKGNVIKTVGQNMSTLVFSDTTYYEYKGKIINTIGRKNNGSIYMGKEDKYVPSRIFRKDSKGKITYEQQYTYTVVAGKITERIDTETGDKITYTYE